MPYLTPTGVRARVSAFSSSDPTDARISQAIAEFEDVAERYIEYACIPRTVVGEQHQIGYGTLVITTTNAWWPAYVILQNRKVRGVTALTINGVTIDPSLYQLDPLAHVVFFRPQIVGSILGPSFGMVAVSYDHGLDAAPEMALRAEALYCRSTILTDGSGVGRDVLTQATDGGGYTRFSMPDNKDHPTGFIEVDRLLNSLRETSRKPAVA